MSAPQPLRALRTAPLLLAGALLTACAGYNLQLGTTASNLSNFHVVYEMPASSLVPWTERSTPIDIPPPPDDASGASTLPASGAALPPERPAGTTRTPGRWRGPMATHTAIAATTTALIRMLSDGFPSSLGTTTIEPFDGRIADTPRLLLWLYRFVPVAAMRNRPVSGAPRPETRPGVRPSAVAVDLHSSVVGAGLAPLQQQQALGWMLRRLSDRPILTTDKLNQGGVVFKPTEDVALLVEELSLAELTALTQPLGPVPPCVLPIHARSIHLEGE